LKFIIVGAGEVGFHIASHLALEDKDVVVIDKDSEATRRVSENIDVQVVNGSGSSPVTLIEAGIQQAELLLAVTDSDETNLAACLMANIISPTTRKLARLRHADYDGYETHFKEHAPHIDMVINPEIEVVKTIDRLMSVPGSVDMGEFAGGRIKFVGIYLEPHARVSGMRLLDLPTLGGDTRPLVAAVVRDEKLIIPRGEDRLKAGDLVYFISEERNLSKTLTFFDKHPEPIGRVMIIGGGRIGFRLAEQLETGSVYCKLIEKNPERCIELAEALNKAVVLQGDGSDQSLLLEENIQDMDLVVTLTDDEETNILTSLLAKRLKAGKTITRITRFSYFPLMTTIGLHQVISPRLSAINSILQHVRRGKVLSAISIKGEQGEVIEAEALETSDIVDKPLKAIDFPKGAIVAGIIRGEEIIIPTGESIVRPRDRIIIFAHRKKIPKIEKILAVKLEYF